MPTIHLSLPEQLYSELKRKSEEMGIQMTDLVKVMIRNGLEGDVEDSPKENTGRLEESLVFLEAKVAQMDIIIGELMKRVKTLEEESGIEEEPEIIKG